MAGNGIAIIGAGMVAGAHAYGYRAFAPRFAEMDLALSVVCDANSDLARRLADTYGFERVERSWQSVLKDPSISIVSICLPNFLHKQVALAALAAGKHVLCEKPLALNSREAGSIHRAASATTAVSGTVFNYRRIPAVADIARRIRAGEFGEILQVTVLYQCDYAADPLLPHSWRYVYSKAGPGALLDLGSHAVDLARFLAGEVRQVVGATANISIGERRVPITEATGHAHAELSDQTAIVDNDDIMSALLRFESGAQGFVSASRVSVGHGNRIHIEVNGSRASARFSTESPVYFEMAVLEAGRPSNFSRVVNRPSSPSVGALSPVPHDLVSVGHAESFSFMIFEFLDAIAKEKPFENGSMLDGYRVALILDAIQKSSRTGKSAAVNWRL
ncbi:MAG: Gfo/Idh/MocA family oxidoreductase [Hyphomicrobiaceae bacterium]|nr:Gfo/Idh/MocA family oxidoreductase [Hyphomicrobiaceae bacterium]